MKWFRILLCSLLLNIAATANAQETILQTLERLRPQYPAGDAAAATYLNAVAWEHRAEGWAMLEKTGGHNCKTPGDRLVACDILVNKNTKRGFDVIKGDDAGTPMAPDGEGEDFTGRTFVDPVQPAGGPVDPPPVTPPPVTPPPVDLGPLTARVQALEAKVQAGEQLAAVLQAEVSR